MDDMDASLDKTAPAVPRPTVMLIDDDEQLREAVAALLAQQGYQVEQCENGLGALEQLRDGASPDVILLDLIMPQMDGWQFRVEQKRDPRFASIPVVAMSADRSAKAEAIDAYAYLEKPVNERELLDTVNTLVESLERDRLESRMREAERLRSLGALAAGIAHQVNNPLAFILGSLELAQQQASELGARLSGPEAFSMVGLHQVLTRAQRGAERIASIVRGIAMFATADTEEVLAIDLNEVVESSIQVASNELRHSARLERDYASVPSVRGNPAKLGQVFLDLLLNAVRAIGDGSQREHVIRVSTSSGPGRTAVVTISDTGRGLTSAMKARIFDPFFSTKSAGSAMGFGLFASREIIESMGGTITVESDPYEGSVYRVALPSGGASVRSRSSGASSSRRRPAVLVIDDEPMMCDLTTALLSDDYEVASFTDARAALASILGGSFDVILCDLMMPGLSGMDLYERIGQERPELAQRVVFMTGGAFTERARAFLAKTRRPQVRKPFRREELTDVIESQLALKH
jgi:signal transduction histidine kinase